MPAAPAISATAAETRASAICREVCRKTGGDFYLATFFLPRPRRDAVHSIFAFCSLLADSVRPGQENSTPATPATVSASCCSTNSRDGRTGLVRQRIEHLFDVPAAVPFGPGRSDQQGIVYAFGRTLERYSIPRDYLIDFIDGCRIEATVLRFATWKSLDRFLALRWGSVALAVAAVLGVTSSDARQPVIDLGKAVGLTKILRNLPERLADGQIPLPLEDLAACQYSERELLGNVRNDRFEALLRLEVERARGLFASGRLAIPSLAGDGSRLMAAAVATLYDRSLDRLTRPLSTWQRVRLLPVIWTAARA